MRRGNTPHLPTLRHFRHLSPGASGYYGGIEVKVKKSQKSVKGFLHCSKFNVYRPNHRPHQIPTYQLYVIVIRYRPMSYMCKAINKQLSVHYKGLIKCELTVIGLTVVRWRSQCFSPRLDFVQIVCFYLYGLCTIHTTTWLNTLRLYIRTASAFSLLCKTPLCSSKSAVKLNKLI